MCSDVLRDQWMVTNPALIREIRYGDGLQIAIVMKISFILDW